LGQREEAHCADVESWARVLGYLPAEAAWGGEGGEIVSDAVAIVEGVCYEGGGSGEYHLVGGGPRAKEATGVDTIGIGGVNCGGLDER
jgi:hypothetical protein